MKVLIVHEPWISLILNGQKTWEIRKQPTKIREQIALGDKGRILGYARIVDCKEMTLQELWKHPNEHQANDFLAGYTHGNNAFAWILADVQKENGVKFYKRAYGVWSKEKT